MNLIKRFLFANALTVIIPLMITVLLAIASFFIDSSLSGAGASIENYQKLLQLKVELAGNPHSVLKSNPEIIEDLSFQNALKDQLATLQGEVILLREDQVVFASRKFTKIDIAKCLEAGQNMKERDILLLENNSYSIEVINLFFHDHTQGYAILLAKLDGSGQSLSRFLTIIAVVFLLSYVLTSILVSRQYTRMIASPLQNLQRAAAEISRGNLDRPIAEEGDKEIQALCRDLETMRLRLKDSVHTQLKYEDNRKVLVSSISHDLKTPVTTIKGYIEGLMDGIANTPEKTAKYLNTIYLKAQQIDQMIDDLLLYAKLDVNQLPFSFEDSDPAEYLQQFLAECEPELELHGIKLNFSNQLTAPRRVLLDKERMRRVFANIIDNSRKYMNKASGMISVSLRETNFHIIIELRDNGTGIEEKDIQLIFDRFYRADASRGETQGSGLGLAIAKQIIEGHHGRIWAVGHGSEGLSIMISLPKTDGGNLDAQNINY